MVGEKRLEGTLINGLSVIVGGLVGLLFRGRISERFNTSIIQGLGLVVLFIGMQMALQSQNAVVVLVSLILGGIAGEALLIEDRFEGFSQRLEARLGGSRGDFARGFVTASLLYCVGPMAVTGAIQNGLTGDYSVLVIKSFLDGISAVALAAGLGFGVAFSAVPVLVYQGGLSLLAGWVKPFLTEPIITEMTATGGVLILAISLSMLQIKKFKVANFLPALFFAGFLAYAWGLIPR